MIKQISFLVLLIILVGCGKQKKSEKASENVKSGAKIEFLWATDTLLRTPESVIYDDKREFIYVANVNENPWEKDGNGFISRVNKEGDVVDLFWVEGLNGPKGMAIVEDILYVADIDALVKINIVTGEISERIPIENANSLNDLTRDEKGKIYMSDSGGGAVYSYFKGDVSVVLSGLEGRPNGLRILDDQLLVLFSEGSRLVKYSLSDAHQEEIISGIGHGDGIMETSVSGNFVISDWEGQLFHFSEENGLVTLQDTREEKVNSADLWFIKETNMMIVPTFFDNRVLAFHLVE